MTTVMALQFPTGRYHATAWDRSVNEGDIEWPPSPWRILRALYATWRWRAPDLDGPTVTDALATLAVAPSFRLPRHTQGHTRHYYPDSTTGTDKVFDPFACLDPHAELFVRWPVALPEGGSPVVAQLCTLLPHLGRADSLCQARLMTEQEAQALPEDGWYDPGDLGDLTHPPARVLAPTVPLDLDALLVSTTEVRSAGRTTPSGARWVSYRHPQPSRPPAFTTHRPRRQASPTAVRLRIASPVLPAIRDTVTYGHVLRLATLSRRGDQSPVLSGKRVGVRRDGHAHAHYLALDIDEDRLLDTAIVWAPEGLHEADVAALTRLMRLTFGAPGFRPVRVAVEAVGAVPDIAPELSGPATTWRSWTPFAPYRHQAKTEPLQLFLRNEIDREPATRGLPPARDVWVLRGPWLDFERLRPGERRSGVRDRRAVGLGISFAEPITGPVSLGALSHFGLGLFRPTREPAPRPAP